MQTFNVYIKNKFSNSNDGTFNLERDYNPIATISAKDLDDAFVKTQNVDSSWVEQSYVTGRLVTNTTSTSVGDVFVDAITNDHYLITDFGFKRI